MERVAKDLMPAFRDKIRFWSKDFLGAWRLGISRCLFMFHVKAGLS